MTIEISLLINIISVSCAVIFGTMAARSRSAVASKEETAEMTTVIVKLENIGTGITEIKTEMTNLKADIKENRERIIKVEESAKQAHKRLDVITGSERR